MTEMTLQDAIAEVKRLWAISRPSPEETNFAAIVFNAAASGALIAKADADLAVALAYQRAGDRVNTYFREQHLPLKERSHGANLGVAAAVLALAPADALAEVKRMQKTLARAEECAKEMQSDLLGYMAEVKALRMQVEGLSADNARLRGIIARAAMTEAQIDRMARAICREQCAFYGEPPCHETGDWPNAGCNEPGCIALARAAAEVLGEKGEKE